MIEKETKILELATDESYDVLVKSLIVREMIDIQDHRMSDDALLECAESIYYKIMDDDTFASFLDEYVLDLIKSEVYYYHEGLEYERHSDSY